MFSLLLLPLPPLNLIVLLLLHLLPLPGSTQYGYWKNWKYPKRPRLRNTGVEPEQEGWCQSLGVFAGSGVDILTPALAPSTLIFFILNFTHLNPFLQHFFCQPHNYEFLLAFQTFHLIKENYSGNSFQSADITNKNVGKLWKLYRFTLVQSWRWAGLLIFL